MSIDYYDQQNMKNARVSQWYDRVVSNLDKCPFCDLKDKYILCEKNNMVLTVNLFGYIDGHLLIIPKKHKEKFVELTKEEWEGVKYLIEKGSEAIRAFFGIENINVLYREGAKAGVSLKHMHLHILPITPEFMQYRKTNFLWEFQELKFTPLDLANELRKHL